MLAEDLIDLPHHQRVQATLNAMAGDGIEAAAVAEAAFTVALAAKLQADALRRQSGRSSSWRGSSRRQSLSTTVDKAASLIDRTYQVSFND